MLTTNNRSSGKWHGNQCYCESGLTEAASIMSSQSENLNGCLFFRSSFVDVYLLRLSLIYVNIPD